MESLKLFYYSWNKRAAFYVLDEMGSDVDKPAQKFRETSLYPLLPLTH